MKRLLLILICCALMTPVKAQVSMRDVWLSMPDSILPYLNKNLRLEHLDFMEMKVRSEVKNLLQGEGVMDTLTTDYVSLQLTTASTLEMRLLTCADSSQVVCFVKTVMAPKAESEVAFYDVTWKPLSESFGLPLTNSLEQILDRFTFRPEGMDAERYEELCRMIDPVMTSAKLSVDEPTVCFQLSTSTFTQQEEEDVRQIVKQIKFKWDGRLFKEI